MARRELRKLKMVISIFFHCLFNHPVFYQNPEKQDNENANASNLYNCHRRQNIISDVFCYKNKFHNRKVYSFIQRSYICLSLLLS